MAGLTIGRHCIDPPLGLAPMAGVTDKPFRILCKSLGAGLAVSEMTASNPDLWQTRKSRLRRDHCGEPGPVIVQIAGTDPQQMARAAQFNVDHGAEIIDINMGCPAKKVVKAWAGSALMGDEALAGRILEAVVKAVDVPVTVKMRTGITAQNRNAVRLARIAEQAGIQALAVHGRTRQQKYQGQAEYDTIAEVKQAVGIPVLANGDIDSPAKAWAVLSHTGADGLLIGRAAQGRPWLFGQIDHYLKHGSERPEPTVARIGSLLLSHVRALHAFYGEDAGVRIARKHFGWYARGHASRPLMRVETAAGQLKLIESHFDHLACQESTRPAAAGPPTQSVQSASDRPLTVSQLTMVDYG